MKWFDDMDIVRLDEDAVVILRQDADDYGCEFEPGRDNFHEGQVARFNMWNYALDSSDLNKCTNVGNMLSIKTHFIINQLTRESRQDLTCSTGEYIIRRNVIADRMQCI